MDTMEMKDIEAAVEGILFASGEPVAVDRLCVALDMDRPTVELVLQHLQDYYSYERRGMRLVRMEDSYQLCSALAEFKSLNDSLNFGSVLCTGNNINRYIIALCVFIPEYAVENAVAFCLLGKLFQVLVGDRKHLQLLARLNHISKSSLAFCFLFLFENRD